MRGARVLSLWAVGCALIAGCSGDAQREPAPEPLARPDPPARAAGPWGVPEYDALVGLTDPAEVLIQLPRAATGSRGRCAGPRRQPLRSAWAAPDGVLASTEACDDDNSSAGDGCNGMCMIEAGWACDRPVDSTGITIENYPGAAAVWSISPDGRTGVQTANTVHGTIGLVGAEGFDATYTYRLRVDDRGSDDDFVGFVIGYNSGDVSSASADFLLLDWKRRDQTAFGVFGAAVRRGRGAVRRMHRRLGVWLRRLRRADEHLRTRLHHERGLLRRAGGL